ncbi:MAG: Uma2 family endonuclease [Chloroflexaceae bacterium]|nr:Uma2 family endonuclease [Chloroflexaceae bacterium]
MTTDILPIAGPATASYNCSPWPAACTAPSTSTAGRRSSLPQSSPAGTWRPGGYSGRADKDLGIIHDRRVHGVPALIVEVLSPSNPAQDLVVKRGAYARAGLPEYWLMRPVERDVLVLSAPDPAAGDYRQETRVAPDGELISPTLPFKAPIAAFFAGAPDETP